MNQKFLKSALCLCLLLPACNNQQEGTTSNPTAEKSTPVASTDTQKTPDPATTAPQDNTISATVLETMNAGGYTYLQVDTGKVKQWVAIPEAKVKAGDKVSYYDGMAMPNFTSKSLNRTFESIIFSPGLVGQGAPQAGPHGMDSTMQNDTSNPHAAMHEAGKPAGADSFASAVQAEASPTSTVEKTTASGGSLGAIAPYTEIKVEKAAGENGYNIEEIFTGNTKLDGKTIRVQGKVVKFSPNIMGKNWIHLQDGSGDPLKGTHDLVITTSAEPPKDKEVITIEGIVRANKDFGAGYSYVVIVEDAKIIP